MHGISLASTVLLYVLCILALWSAARNAVRVSELQDLLQRSPSSRIESLERQVREVTDAMEELANRVKMMKVRRAADHSSGEPTGMPDPYKDPDAWRRKMNSNLAARRMNPGT